MQRGVCQEPQQQPQKPSGTKPRTSTTRPSTMREAGEARSSRAPCSVASVRNAAAVSKLIFRNGERLQSMPARLHARYPPWPHEVHEVSLM